MTLYLCNFESALGVSKRKAGCPDCKPPVALRCITSRKLPFEESVYDLGGYRKKSWSSSLDQVSRLRWNLG